MSEALATSFGLMLYAVLLLPLVALATSFPRGKMTSIAIYAAVILLIGLGQTGIFQANSLTAVGGITPSVSLASDSRCQEVMRVVQQAGLGIDRSDPYHITLKGDAWDQAPQTVRDFVIACAERNPQPGTAPSAPLGTQTPTPR